MKVWKLTAANNLEQKEEELVPVAGKRRVRVTKVLLSPSDVAIYRGEKRVEYPRILGRFAVGMIMDDNEDGLLPKGTRVLLHANLPETDYGTHKPDYEKMEPLVCGVNTDGYLRDFVYVNEQNLTPLPDAVNDNKALHIQYIALAKAAVEALAPAKGDHIAVIGGDIIGLYVCLLLIYQQVAPLLIDTRADRLEFAHGMGVYYTHLIDEKLMEKIASVTGGRLCDGVVVTTDAKIDDKNPFAVCASDKNVVFCGTSEEEFSLKLSDIFKKQLSVHGVSDGADYIETATNLIANKAIDVSAFSTRLFGFEKLKEALDKYSDGPHRKVNEMTVINLV